MYLGGDMDAPTEYAFLALDELGASCLQTRPSGCSSPSTARTQQLHG